MLRRPPRSTLFPYTTPSDLALLAAGPCDEDDATAVGDGLGHDATRRDRLVVRMGMDRHQRRAVGLLDDGGLRSEEHTSELQSHVNLVCRLLLEKKKKLSNIH